jgi:acetyl esterase/lipase
MSQAREAASGVHLHEGIEFAGVLGYRPVQLDLYLPPAQSADTADTAVPPPVVLFLHGGGWAVGTRKSASPAIDDWDPSFFERLALAGFAVASADYRLSEESRFPAQLHDAKAAVRWLRKHAARYGFDGERIVAWGGSAGGHLAALVGLTGDVAELEGTVGEPRPGPPVPPPPPAPGETPISTRVAGVIDWYGPVDLPAMVAQDDGTGLMEHDSPESPEGRLIGARISENPGLARAASPITYVHAGAPPFLIMHGTADRGVSVAQSKSLAEALRAVGVHVETEWVEGSDHMWMGAPDIEAIFNRSVKFARQVTERSTD